MIRLSRRLFPFGKRLRRCSTGRGAAFGGFLEILGVRHGWRVPIRETIRCTHRLQSPALGGLSPLVSRRFDRKSPFFPLPRGERKVSPNGLLKTYGPWGRSYVGDVSQDADTVTRVLLTPGNRGIRWKCGWPFMAWVTPLSLHQMDRFVRLIA